MRTAPRAPSGARGRADAFGARALLAATGVGGALLVLSFLLVPGVIAGEELRDRLEAT